MAAQVTACPSCVFGAVSSTTLSFTWHAIETITVSIIPHVTVWTNGTSQTSWQNITETKTDYVGAGSNSSHPKTFSNKNDITWTVGDATLTYPTSYIQYLAFDGAPITSDKGQTCAEPTLGEVELPASTDAASFIYALAGNATAATALPTPLLDYLAALPEVSSQFNGAALAGCAPLAWSAPASVSASSTGSSIPVTYSSHAESDSSSVTTPVSQTSYTSSTSSPAYYSTSTIPSTSSSRAYYTPSVAPYGNSSMYFVSSSQHYGGPSTKLRNSHSPLSTTSTSQTPGHNNPLPVPGSASVCGGGSLPCGTDPGLPSGYGSSTAAGEGSSTSVPAYHTSLTTAPAVGTLTHTTAFVIEPITGPTTYTTMTPRGADHTKHTEKPGGTHTGGGSAPGGYQHHTGDHNGHTNKPTDKPNPSGPGGYSPHNSQQPHNGNQPHNGQQPPHHDGNGPHDHPAGNDSPPVYTHGHTTISAKTGGAVVVGSKTVQPGHKVTIGTGTSKTVVALQTKGGHTHLIVGGSTYGAVPHRVVTQAAVGPDKTGASVAVVTTNGHTITAIRSGKSLVLADGSSTVTVQAGKHTTFEGQAFNAPHNGNSIEVNSHRMPFTAVGTSQAVVTAGGHTFTAVDVGKSVVLKDGSSTIIVKDGAQTKFEGQTVSVHTKGGAVEVNGETKTLSATAESTPTGSAVVTAGGHTFTAVDAGKSVILKDGSSTVTVKDGAQTKFEGQTVSVHTKGGAVVVNGETKTLSMTDKSTPTGSAVVTAGGHTITALDKPGSVVLKDGTSTVTVEDGKLTTFEAQTVSVPPHGGAVVVNGKTTTFTSSSTKTTTGIGGYVHSGLGGKVVSPTPSSSSNLAGTNAAASTAPNSLLSIVAAVVFCFVSMLATL